MGGECVGDDEELLRCHRVVSPAQGPVWDSSLSRRLSAVCLCWMGRRGAKWSTPGFGSLPLFCFWPGFQKLPQVSEFSC